MILIIKNIDFRPFAPPPTVDPATLTCGVPPSFCTKSSYRTLDGSCNNLQNPGWGIPQTPYGRLLPAKYGDGKFKPFHFSNNFTMEIIIIFFQE